MLWSSNNRIEITTFKIFKESISASMGHIAQISTEYVVFGDTRKEIMNVIVT